MIFNFRDLLAEMSSAVVDTCQYHKTRNMNSGEAILRECG